MNEAPPLENMKQPENEEASVIYVKLVVIKCTMKRRTKKVKDINKPTFPSLEKCSSRSLSVTLVDRPVT